MLRRSIVGLAVVLMFVAGAALAADKPDTKGKKEIKGGIKGTIVKVDADKMELTIKTEDGKNQTYELGEDTQVIGPHGGVSKLGIKDDRMTTGMHVTVVKGEGKMLKAVHVGNRKPKKGTEPKPAATKGETKETTKVEKKETNK